MRRSSQILIAMVVASWISGCAHAPVRTNDPRQLFEAACAAGGAVKSAKGSVWLKAKSKELSGQFPALIRADSIDHMQMEITNLVGGTEAVITVDGLRFKIEARGKKPRTEQGFGSWGGIPIQWASQLFLGRIPCPPEPARATANLSLGEGRSLIVDTQPSVEGGAERFEYKFRDWGGKPWPESLNWERRGTMAQAVELKFDEPEDGTGTPKKWEARSAVGEVKVRWRDRDVNK